MRSHGCQRRASVIFRSALLGSRCLSHTRTYCAGFNTPEADVFRGFGYDCPDVRRLRVILRGEACLTLSHVHLKSNRPRGGDSKPASEDDFVLMTYHVRPPQIYTIDNVVRRIDRFADYLMCV